MLNTVFGKMTYSTGWKTQRTITLFESSYHITVKLQAYKEDAELPSKQLQSCKLFTDRENKMLADIENLMRAFSDDFSSRFKPQTLLIKRNGSIALLCDDAKNPDEGIAVCLFPEECIMSQDDYL